MAFPSNRRVKRLNLGLPLTHDGNVAEVWLWFGWNHGCVAAGAESWFTEFDCYVYFSHRVTASV